MNTVKRTDANPRTLIDWLRTVFSTEGPMDVGEVVTGSYHFTDIGDIYYSLDDTEESVAFAVKYVPSVGVKLRPMRGEVKEFFVFEEGIWRDYSTDERFTHRQLAEHVKGFTSR